MKIVMVFGLKNHLVLFFFVCDSGADSLCLVRLPMPQLGLNIADDDDGDFFAFVHIAKGPNSTSVRTRLNGKLRKMMVRLE